MNKAQQMRNLSDGDGKAQGMNKIYSHIKEYAKMGKKDTTISCDIMNEAQANSLRDEGFTVKRVPDFRDGDFYSISW